MKKILFALVIAFLLCGCSSRTYEDGFENGYRAGYSSAEAELEYQIDEEWYDGYEFGYDEGYYEAEHKFEESYDEGYAEGEYVGFYAGTVYTCLFFGDIDRAFKSAENGSAWYAFVDSYDELISDIYETDEERGEIVWALIGLMLNDNISSKDAEFLVDVFGAELFARNGVSLPGK